MVRDEIESPLCVIRVCMHALLPTHITHTVYIEEVDGGEHAQSEH